MREEKVALHAGLILGGASPRTRPLFFVSPKKRGKRKATRVARSALRADCPVLLESQGRPGMARRLRRRLAVAESPPVFCDAQRALMGPKNPVGRCGPCREQTWGGVLRVSFPHVYVCCALRLVGNAARLLSCRTYCRRACLSRAWLRCLGCGFTRLE